MNAALIVRAAPTRLDSLSLLLDKKLRPVKKPCPTPLVDLGIWISIFSDTVHGFKDYNIKVHETNIKSYNFILFNRYLKIIKMNLCIRGVCFISALCNVTLFWKLPLGIA